MPSPRLNGFNLHYQRAGQGPAVVIHPRRVRQPGLAAVAARGVHLEGESHSLVIRSAKAQEAVRQFIKEAEQN